MGNKKFRLSNMIPNAWFYKLKDMGKASRRSTATQNWQKRSQTQRTNITPSSHSPQPQQANLSNRTSYYFPSRERTEKLSCSPIHPKASDTHFPVDPPRKSNGRIKPRPARPTIKLVSPDSSMCEGSSYHCKDYRDDLRSLPITDSGGFCRVVSSSIDNIVDMDKDSSFDKYFDGVLELDLPPIITKPVKKVVSGAYSDGIAEGSEQRRNPERKTQSGIHRIKIKESSPRLPKRRTQACHRSRKSFRSKVVMRQGNLLSESFAVMKSSSDPQRDFKESMVEMIIENNIRASEDMEELLACYLSLNSDEYRKIIVDVFMAIWLDITNMKL